MIVLASDVNCSTSRKMFVIMNGSLPAQWPSGPVAFQPCGLAALRPSSLAQSFFIHSRISFHKRNCSFLVYPPVNLIKLFFLRPWQQAFPGHLSNVYTQAQEPANRLGREYLKEEVSLYRWPPVWLVWNQLYDYWQFLFLLFLFAIQTNPNQSKQEVNGTVILPPLVFHGPGFSGLTRKHQTRLKKVQGQTL